MKKFNDRLALIITNAVGSMICAYIFAAIAFVSLPSAIMSTIQTGNMMPIISWITQTFLQLVLLSVILKGQNISGELMGQMVKQISDNTEKTEAAAERIEHIVDIIEQDEEKELGKEGLI
jgi:ABC-type multidrug transport system fused ATPase/permease subunit